MKSKRRQKDQSRKASKRQRVYNATGKGNSRYARKAAYLHKNKAWGFEIENKPWK